jgi:hypothetical protein
MTGGIRRACLWALNVTLFAALLDAAIETSMAGSPLRVVVAGAVAVYAIALVVAWPRIGLALKAELSAALLTAILAYDGWSLGTVGSALGVMIAGTDADVLAAVAVAGLVAFAALAVLFMPRVPPALRILVAVFLAYPAVTIGIALARGSGGLMPAMQSNAPFPAGTFWMRGAYLGSTIVLPAAAVVALIAAAALAARKRGDAAARFAAAALAFALGTQLGGLEAQHSGLPAFAFAPNVRVLPAVAVNDQPTAQPLPTATSQALALTGQPSGTSAASPNAVPATLTIPAAGNAQDAEATLSAPAPGEARQQDAVSHLDSFAESLPAQTYDVDAFADQLGPGVAPAFAFVRDNVRFESYSGMLRGFRGTFTARAGNALDRSVLLAHILSRKGVNVRFATGHLSNALADRLYDRMFAVPSAASRTPQALAQPDIGGLRSRIFARARRDYAVISAALGASGSGASIPSRSTIDTEIASHVWLQAQVGGTWTDLDTAFADAAPGHAYATVDTTYADVPQGMMQHVTVRVTAETLANGALTTETPLEVTLPAWQLLDKQIFFSHAGSGLSGTLVGNKDAATPVLWVAGDEHSGKAIQFAAASAKSGAFGGAAFDFGGSSGAASPNAPAFVSESLEFEIDEPDGTQDITRSTLIDRADPIWREGTAHDVAGLRDLPRDPAGAIIATQSLYNIWLSAGDHDLRGYADAVAALTHSVATPDPGASPVAMSFAREVWPFALGNFTLPVLSDHVIVPSLDDSPQLHFYADSPRIFVFGIQPDPTGKRAIFETDLRRDALRGVTRDPSGEAAVLQHKIWFGVLEGALEQELGSLAAERDGSDPASSSSTSNLLAAGGVVVLRPGSDADAGATDKQTAAAIRAASASGDTLVIPKNVLQGGPAGWWQIAHAGGDTHAVLDTNINGFKVIDPVGGAGGEIPTWGNVGGKTLQLNNPYGVGGGKSGGPGGGEIGEYNATNDLMAFTAEDYKIIGSTVAALFGVFAAVFEACGGK